MIGRDEILEKASDRPRIDDRLSGEGEKTLKIGPKSTVRSFSTESAEVRPWLDSPCRVAFMPCPRASVVHGQPSIKRPRY